MIDDASPSSADRFHETELRAVRVTTVAVGFMTLIMAAVWAITLRASEVPHASLRVFAAVLAVPGMLALVVPALSMRGTRAVAASIAAAQVALAIGLLVNAWSGTSFEAEAFWPFSITVIAATAATVAGGTWVAGATLAALTVLLQLVRFSGGEFDFGHLVNDLQALLSSVIVIALCDVFLRGVRDLDRTVSGGMVAERARASSNGRRAAQQHAQAVVHDEVLATLLLVAQDHDVLRAAVADQAGRVLRRIAELERGMDDEPVQRSAFRSRITRIAGRVAPGTAVDASCDGGQPLEAPVAEALAGATEQALVNSVQHAGSATRSVAIEANGDAVAITISDDGAGFAADEVPDDRFGVTASILGRMRAVGGRGEITSAPGRGTTVRLEWRPPVLSTEPALSLTHFPDGLRNIRRIVVGYCVLEGIMAALITGQSDSSETAWASFVALGGIVVSLAVLGWRDLARPSRARAAAAVALATVTAVVATVLAVDVHGFVAAWALTAVAFVLAAVALRGRPGIALAALAVLTGAGFAVVVAGEVPLPRSVVAIGRPVVIVGLAVVATALLRWLWRRTLAARAEHMSTLVRTAGNQAARAELRARAEELETLVGPSLARVRDGEHSADLRAECASLEGQLRDRYRGGRLARQPIVGAAARARRRGVDVVLLDDAGSRDVGDAQLDEIAEWMARRLDTTDAGRFTGRLLPADSPTVASAVIGAGVEMYRS